MLSENFSVVFIEPESTCFFVFCNIQIFKFFLRLEGRLRNVELKYVMLHFVRSDFCGVVLKFSGLFLLNPVRYS